MNIDELRACFPGLSASVYGKPLVYLDNSATSQRAQSVMDKWNEISVKCNANLHRAVHKLAVDATEEYESTRDAVKEYIGAEHREEIVFTSGATASINLVASSFGDAFISGGDKIIIAESEHHSNLVPGQMLAKRKKAEIVVLPVDDEGHISGTQLARLIDSKTRLLCVAQISNVLGIENDIKNLVNICHSKDCLVLADGAQGIVHGGMDVRETDVDFYVFSGHKMYAAPGTGVLYGKKELLEKMPPYMGGGEMIETVSFAGTSYAPLPMKFEAGTQNIAGTPSLKPAIEMLRLMQTGEISDSYRAVCDYVLEALQKDDRIKLYGVPRGTEGKIGLFSFTVKGVHHEDLALILDKMGIAVRSGQMCAEPLMDRFGVTGMVRASFAPYNTMQEAEYFIVSLDRAIKMLA